MENQTDFGPVDKFFSGQTSRNVTNFHNPGAGYYEFSIASDTRPLAYKRLCDKCTKTLFFFTIFSLKPRYNGFDRFMRSSMSRTLDATNFSYRSPEIRYIAS